uniref:Uncharacterized protein n=1 Tax=Arundo donax TaxID=35708 RepID=A0A0A9AUN0_ARUDO
MARVVHSRVTFCIVTCQNHNTRRWTQQINASLNLPFIVQNLIHRGTHNKEAHWKTYRTGAKHTHARNAHTLKV